MYIHIYIYIYICVLYIYAYKCTHTYIQLTFEKHGLEPDKIHLHADFFGKVQSSTTLFFFLFLMIFLATFSFL